MEATQLDRKNVTVVGAPTGRIYRMSLWFTGFSIFFLAFGIVFLGAFIRGVFSSQEGPDFGGIVVGLVLPVVGAGMAIKAFSSRISFTSDSVESSWAMGRESMPLSAICGRREYVVRGKSGATRYLRLESNDGSDPLDFGKYLYRFDDAFWQWFNQIPDLDARDKEEKEERDKEKEDRDPKNHKDSNFGLV